LTSYNGDMISTPLKCDCGRNQTGFSTDAIRTAQRWVVQYRQHGLAFRADFRRALFRVGRIR
jgi:hypothetical protein